eukprot:8663197-Alexandrium_andersonii.AAC.1
MCIRDRPRAAADVCATAAERGKRPGQPSMGQTRHGNGGAPQPTQRRTRLQGGRGWLARARSLAAR